MFFRKIILLAALMFVGNIAMAADPAPLAMLKSLSAQMTSELDRNIGNLKGNDRLVDGLVRRILLPHFDLTTMSRAVIGRDYWNNASSATQQQFIKEFTRYVIKTYSSALQSYEGEVIKFYPMRGLLVNPHEYKLIVLFYVKMVQQFPFNTVCYHQDQHGPFMILALMA
jgi:phospholipid transport system substrate-binding protein